MNAATTRRDKGKGEVDEGPCACPDRVIALPPQDRHHAPTPHPHTFLSLLMKSEVCLDILRHMLHGPPHMSTIFVETAQHHRAPKHADKECRHLVRVHALANLLSFDPPGRNARNGGAPVIHRPASALSQGRVSIIGLNSGIEDRATTCYRRVIHNRLKDRKNCHQALNRVLFARESLVDALLNQLVRVVECLQRKLLFAGEVVVDTTLFQPGLAHDIRQRGAEVALAVEELRRSCQNSLACQFTLTHLYTPFPSKAPAACPIEVSAGKTGSCSHAQDDCQDEPAEC